MSDLKFINLKSVFEKDNYTDYLISKYDLQVEDATETNVPMINVDELSTFEWNIGVIIGNSGMGKSTILKELGEVKTPIYDETKTSISQFPNMSEKDAVELLFSVGLSSVPSLLRKPHELSMGEKARLDIAWHIVNTKEGETIYIDEFTSTVNRAAAKSMSFALQRFIRKINRKIVLASCHFDIISYLQPDWVYNLNIKDNGMCHIEKYVYTPDKPNEVYSKVNEKEILSDDREVN